MSYNGIGLSSAKGSSTSGHIQKSLFQKKQEVGDGKEYASRVVNRERMEWKSKEQRIERLEVDKSIVEHEEARKFEIAVAEHRDLLEEKYPDKTDEEIEEMVEVYRRELKELEKGR